MARVFISHSSEDVALAGEVHRWLVEAGHEVFMHQDPHDGIALGQDWEQGLHERLRWANAMVCVVTSAYLRSMWCAAEVGVARSMGNKLLPLRAEPGVEHPLLTGIQSMDHATDPAAIQDAVLTALRQVDTTWPEDRSPFPGLRPFESDQHLVFFGRANEVEELAELLRSPAEHAKSAALLVVGPSGCGKSSLVRAGLLPMLADEPGWRTLPPILPGSDPMAALARELTAAARRSALDWTVEHVHHQLDQHGLTGLADELLVADPGGPRQRLLIVVDQFEELLTQTPSTERARFAELLHSALTGPVRVVATMRPEFLAQLLLDPDLAALPTHTYTLRPLRREGLRAVIEKPAGLAGIEVDDELVDRLVDDTDAGEALPLLAFTLAQLAEGVSRGGRLSSARYDQLGGVQGALTRQADAALDDAVTAGWRNREQVIAGLLRLVTVDEQGRPTRWRVNRAELPTPVLTELDAFVERRLLTTDEDNGSGVVGVAHEAFLSAWPPLAEAITASVSALRARRAVEHAAAEWSEHGRSPARLWEGGQLAATVTDTGARLWVPSDAAPPQRQRWFRRLLRRHRVLVTDHVDLSAKAHDFLHASIRHDRYRRRRATTVLSVLLVLSLVAAGVAVVAQGNAEQGQRIATARQLITQAEATLEGDPQTALQLGIAAQQIYPDPETHSSLINLLTGTQYAGTLTGLSGFVESTAFSPDGQILAMGGGSYDGTVILWDFADRTRPRQIGEPLTGHSGSVDSVAFSPGGRTLAIGGTAIDGTEGPDSVVTLWDLNDPARPHRIGEPLTGQGSQMNSVAFSPDGHILAIGGSGESLWDLSELAAPRRIEEPLTGHTNSVFAVAFSPDGKTLATGSHDGTSMLWDLVDRTRPRQIGPPLHDHLLLRNPVAFSHDGRILAIGGEGATVILLDLADPAHPRRIGQSLTGHADSVTSLAFSPDKRTLATGSGDGITILWDFADPTQPQRIAQPLTIQKAPNASLALSPDGRILATSVNRAVILWDITDPVRPTPLWQPPIDSGPGSPLAFSPDGRTLATGGDGSVVLWDIIDPTRPRRLGPPLENQSNFPVSSVAFSPDGRALAIGNHEGSAMLWNLSDPTQPQRVEPPLTPQEGSENYVTFSPDGRTLVTNNEDNAFIIWDLSDSARPRRLGQPLGSGVAAFSPDGHTMATGVSLTLWDLTGLNNLRDHAVERACAITSGGFDRDEWNRYVQGLPFEDTCPT